MEATVYHDNEDALSLSDLPLIQYESSEENKQLPLTSQHDLDLDFDFDFDFCCPPSNQSEMRAADEIFFQGQIMPTHSDYPGSEYNSSTSSRSSSSSAARRSLFHSHPSPSPRRIRSHERRIILKNNYVKKPWSWSFFRVGLIAAPPPEFEYRDLKARCNVKSTCMRSGGVDGEKKLRVKAWDLSGGCKKCSVVDAVDVAGSHERRRRGDEENLVAAMNVNKSVNHRTFEWLKQLSIHGAYVRER